MKPIRTHLVWVAIALSAIAMAGPVATAGAATGAGRATTVTGPTYITSSGATFTNTNNQESPAGNTIGNQVAE